MKLVGVIAFVGAALAWVVAVGCWIISLWHLSGRRSVTEMIFRGIEAFNGENFTDEGRRWQKRFLIAMAVFALFVVGAVSVAMVERPRSD